MKRVTTLFFATSLLSGCALAALPVVTGGVLATRDVIRDGSGRSQNASDEISAAEDEQTNQVNNAQTAAQTAIASAKGKTAVRASGEALAKNSFANPYAPLIAYAAAAIPSESGEGNQTLLSAVLAEPSALNGKRIECVDKKPVLLVDIDPHEGLLDLNQPFAPNPTLAAGLATLRRNDIEIAWVSGTSASQAGKLRAVLNATGLDSDGSDTLLLMRYKADRKQTRRAELAASNCIIAIAGGSRTDFDELYEYLLDPASAFALETLINNGWFLTPNALTQD